MKENVFKKILRDSNNHYSSILVNIYIIIYELICSLRLSFHYSYRNIILFENRYFHNYIIIAFDFFFLTRIQYFNILLLRRYRSPVILASQFTLLLSIRILP